MRYFYEDEGLVELGAEEGGVGEEVEGWEEGGHLGEREGVSSFWTIGGRVQEVGHF